MRAGKLVHVITIERAGPLIDEWGGASEGWAKLATLRAEIILQTTTEFLRAQGAQDEATLAIRTRFFPGITTADRVAFQGEAYGIREIAPIGRNRGLELRCVRVG